MRQVADEAYGVGDQHLPLRWESYTADGGVERGEHARGGEHSGVGERVEKRGLARVGVSDQRDGSDRDGFAALALLRAGATHVFDLIFHVADAAVDFAAVGF